MPTYESYAPPDTSFSSVISSIPIAELSTPVYYTKRLAKQPVFDFMIQDTDFYINTHGVSVTELGKSYTTLSNGLFYILNKSSQSFVFNSLNVTSVRFRNESAIPASTLKISFNKTTYNTTLTERYDTYDLLFRSKIIGELRISRKTKYDNDLNFTLNPFQSIEFGASYSVKNVNMLDTQYYGLSNINPNRRKGTIDIGLTIKSFTDLAMTNAVYESVTLTVNLVNTGYVPAIIAPGGGDDGGAVYY
jgi:hypothetical protein